MIDNENYAIFLTNLLNEFNLNSKYIRRDNRYMIYMKEAEKIGDFLRIIGATTSLFYYEDIRIYRDHKNMTNRLNNCEQANVDKIIETANSQIKDIEKIESIGGLDLLDEKTKEAAIYRKKYPESSLLELSEIISLETGNKITKSGLYHRMKKIKDVAARIK
jgi:DNA-binding protein WhiA